MKNQKELSGVGKTKKEFEKSLAALAKEKPLNKINVKQLCETAHLSRNAFYFHYSDINALISEVKENMLAQIAALIDGCRGEDFSENLLDVINGLTDFFIENKDTAMMLIDCSPEFIDRLNKLYSDFYYEYFKQYHKSGSRELYDMFYCYVSSAFNGMMKYWMHNRETVPRAVFVRLAYLFTKKLVIGESV